MSTDKPKHRTAGEKAKQTRMRRQAAAKAVVTRQLRAKQKSPTSVEGKDPVELLLAEWAAEVASGICVVCGESMPSCLDEFPVNVKTRRRGTVTLCGSCLMVVGQSDDPVRDLMERRRRRKNTQIL